MAGILPRLSRKDVNNDESEHVHLNETPKTPGVTRRLSKIKVAVSGCCLMCLVIPSAGMMGILYLMSSGKDLAIQRSSVADVESMTASSVRSGTRASQDHTEIIVSEDSGFFKEVQIPDVFRQSVKMIVSGTLDRSQFRINPEALQGMIPGVDVSELRFVIERESTAGEEDMLGVDPDTRVVIYEFRTHADGEVMKEVVLFQNGAVAMK